MSVESSAPVVYRKKNNDRRSAGVVKSLIFEFEQLNVIVDSQNGIPKMGSEQSSTPKVVNLNSTTIASKSLIKQRVTQFDLENEYSPDKRKRYKSASENIKTQNILSKDFKRSKSTDFNRYQKDIYSRSRQVAPKINKETNVLVNPHRKDLHVGDTNNNPQKKSTRRKVNCDSATAKVNKEEKLASIKTGQRLNERFNITESCPQNLTNGNISKEKSSKETKLEPNLRDYKKKIRSVKSIKKVFENGQIPGSVPIRKATKNKSLSNLDTPKISNETVNKDKVCPNQFTETDNNVSVTGSSNISDDANSENNNYYNLAEEMVFENEPNLENYRQRIINNITREFHKLKSLDENDDNSEDEFHEINSSMQDMQRTIEEIERKYKTETETALDNPLSEENSELQRTFQKINGEAENVETIEQIQVTTNNQAKECTDKEESESEKSEDWEKEDLRDIETIDVYLSNTNIYDTEGDEFGKRGFGSTDDVSFVEAYNQIGKELIVTAGLVEYRSISENLDGVESLESLDEKVNNDNMDNSTEDLPELKPNIQTESIPVEDSEIPKETFKSTPEETPPIVIIASSSNDLEQTNSTLEDLESGSVSNRSTIYSNTATNSSDSIDCLCKTESEDGSESEKYEEPIYEEIRIIDNDVEIRNNSNNRYERGIKTETTIYDSFRNPRIAKVSNINSSEYMARPTLPIPEETELKEVPKSPTCGLKPKKDYIIEELIDTEKKYIKHLEKVVWDYMPVITDKNLPSSLIGKSTYLFGNIEKIYKATQKFHKDLMQCGNDHEKIAKTFLTYKRLFEYYPLYSKNKPVADQYLLGDFKDVVAAREKQLNDRLGLASNLLTPIQRLGKYVLFLEQIQKELKKNEGIASENVNKAIDIVRKHLSRGNDFIAIDSIKNSPISLVEQGSFVVREKFNIIKPRKYEAMLFLFEEILVFTTVDPRNPEKFVYKDSIKLNEMGIITSDDQPLVFHLKRFPSFKKDPKESHEFVIEAKKTKDKRTWTELIEKRLWEQLIQCKEKQSELHNNQGVRNSVVELPDRIRRKKTGYSSLPSEMRKNSRTSIFYYKIARDA